MEVCPQLSQVPPPLFSSAPPPLGSVVFKERFTFFTCQGIYLRREWEGYSTKDHFIPNTEEEGIYSLSRAWIVVTGMPPVVSEFRAEVQVARQVSMNRDKIL